MDRKIVYAIALAWCVVSVGATADAGGGQPGETARRILRKTENPGGLLVHVGCGDGTLTAELAECELVVQGLDTDPDDVRRTRRRLKDAGDYGRATARAWNGDRLPYVDNLVNVLVVDEEVEVSRREMKRVLAPRGRLYLQGENGWSAESMEWPKELDEWPMYMHDSRGSFVSEDQRVGPPEGLRWTGGPMWARSHEHTAAMQAMVTAEGRMFHVMDEGPTESIQLPSRYTLTARDAFNGSVLWTKELPDWFNDLFPLKSGPAYMPRRLVAAGDRVYVSPGAGHNLLALDAATGRELQEYSNTATTMEFIHSNGTLFAAIEPEHDPVDYRQQHPNCWRERDRARNKWTWKSQHDRKLRAIDPESGEVLWERDRPVAPMTLAADDRMVCFYNGESVVALDRDSGRELWTSEPVRTLPKITTDYGPRLAIRGSTVTLAPRGEIYALDARNGRILWHAGGRPASGHFSPEDFYVIGDTAWAGAGGVCNRFLAYDLETGTRLADWQNPIDAFYIHQRCYPGRANQEYLMPPVMGATFVDLDSGDWQINHWIRGGCIYGMMPANGLLYSVPHACACYYQSKLNGFNAAAPTSSAPADGPRGERLVKGPAYGSTDEHGTASWPTLRHDNARTGYIQTDVPADVQKDWQVDLDGELSQPTAGYGKLFISNVDAHTIYALDQETGEKAWEFTAGGRVSSPPALHNGRAYFGCTDGCIYALRAADGELCWRFRVAPRAAQVMSYGQLESAWPLDGTVLIQHGTLYAVAGRSMFLDGGLRMVLLDPETGELIRENVMDENVPGSDKKLQDLMMGKHMPVAMPDVLSSDGNYVYMKSQTFNMDGERVRIRPQRPDTQYGKEVHLFSPTSLLDDHWHQREYWLYGRAAGEGWAEFQLPPKRVPYGRIMCLDEKNAYAYAREPELLCNTSIQEYRLYSARKKPERRVGINRLEGSNWPEPKFGPNDGLARHTVNWQQLDDMPAEKLTALDYNWETSRPDIMMRAMVLADDILFSAGPPDVANEKKLWGQSHTEEYREKMRKQAAALRGELGAELWAVSKDTGERLARYELDVLPAFDGLIAARGRLFMTTEDGSVLSFTERVSRAASRR